MLEILVTHSQQKKGPGIESACNVNYWSMLKHLFISN